MTHIILPELGEGISKATVACWHAKIGDQVKEGDDIVEVVTDKAVFCIAAPATGKLELIQVADGKESAVGSVLGAIR